MCSVQLTNLCNIRMYVLSYEKQAVQVRLYELFPLCLAKKYEVPEFISKLLTVLHKVKSLVSILHRTSNRGPIILLFVFFETHSAYASYSVLTRNEGILTFSAGVTNV